MEAETNQKHKPCLFKLETKQTLDIGSLKLYIGHNWDLKDDVLHVPFGASLSEVAEFLESVNKTNH